MNTDPRENGYDQAEQWIDDALAEYSKAEPRSGFEGRLLVRLQAEEQRSPEHGWWRWALASGLAAMLLLALLWSRYPNARHGADSQIANAGAKTTEPAVSRNELIEPTHPRQGLLKKARIKRPLPKQEQFPTPSPLNDQERMLVRFVQDYPERAALMAQAQADLRSQDEKEMSQPWPDAGANDSKQK